MVTTSTAPSLFRIPLIVGLVLLLLPAAAPGAQWPRYSTPEEAGFSSERLAAAESLWLALDDAPVASLFVVYRGRVLVDWGDSRATYWCHSMRKSFLSALYGIHVERGNIDLGRTMQDLGIDDAPPLNREEKQARVSDLLKARSGVYHPAACEVQAMRDARPERGSHPRDTFWYYNNWDFNALGTIFRQETGADIFRDFDQRIAKPLGMQDFSPSQCEYPLEPQYSIHPCYTFRMSARDRARFGQLFLQNGRWKNRQIVPGDWVEESTRAWSRTDTPGEGYGYMWWTYEPRFFRTFFGDSRLHHLNGFLASGYGGQLIFVLPDADLVLVTAVDVYAGGDLEGGEMLPILQAILTAREIVDLRLLKARADSSDALAGGPMRLTSKVRNRNGAASLATTVDYYFSPIGHPSDDPIWVGADDVPSIAMGRSKTVQVTVTLPGDLPPGDYRLVTLLDADKINYDLRRKNNLHLNKSRIQIR